MTLSANEYRADYERSLEDPEAFWREQALKYLHWNRPFTQTKLAEFKPPYRFEWFKDGELNVSYNCVDRHLETDANTIALIWQSDELKTTEKISYKKLHQQVNAFASLLQAEGVQSGDVVTLYMPMIPEAIYAMLACARIGAIHSVVFGGFSGEALAQRLNDADSKFLITASHVNRGGQKISFKPLLDVALKRYTALDKMIVVDRDQQICSAYPFAIDYDLAIKAHQTKKVAAKPFPSEQPLFILYTSGSTGRPKGLLHTSAGYLLYTTLSFQTLFNYQKGNVYWCTADIGWITGHSYAVYGPLCSGATIYLYEGVPNQPQDRIWQIIAENKINLLYTAPTLIRSLMKATPSLEQYDLSSLKLLGTVGEPINPEAWQWYFEQVGRSQCPIIDTWWQTETGGVLISPITDKMEKHKPGMARQPFFGVEPALLDESKQKIHSAHTTGALCMKQPWPGQARSIYGDHDRFIETYYSAYPGYYFSGDSAQFDKDHEFYIAGRMDDVINVSGHRLSTAEIESALVTHPAVCEAAVIGQNDPDKGQAVCAFVITRENRADLEAELIQTVREQIGPIAKPKHVQIVSNLPKTRSGKIMRRILKKIVHGQTQELGDTSTLVNPEIIEELIQKLGNSGARHELLS